MPFEAKELTLILFEFVLRISFPIG